MVGTSVHAPVLVHLTSVARVRARRMSAGPQVLVRQISVDPHVLVRRMSVNVREGVREEWGALAVAAVPEVAAVAVAVVAAEAVAEVVTADGATPKTGRRKS